MNKMDKHIQAIADLEDQDVYEWPESDYGKAEVWYRNRRYDIYAIPMYGGEPTYEQSVETPEQAAEIVNSWT